MPCWGASNEYPQHMFLWRYCRRMIIKYSSLTSTLLHRLIWDVSIPMPQRHNFSWHSEHPFNLLSLIFFPSGLNGCGIIVSQIQSGWLTLSWRNGNISLQHFKILFSYFPLKTKLGISCESTPKEMIHVQCTALHSGKRRKTSPICRLLIMWLAIQG